MSPQFDRRHFLKASLALAGSLWLRPFSAAASENPFALVRSLREKARASGKPVIDAGTGNPNFLHRPARQAHQQLYQTALQLTSEGLTPPSKGLADKLMAACPQDSVAAQVLERALGQGRRDDHAEQLLQMLLGNSYAGFQPLTEQAARVYLQELLGCDFEAHHFHPTSGASEGLSILLELLKERLGPEDVFMEVVPTFSPFLLEPEMQGRYQLNRLRLRSDRRGFWTLDEKELKKLADPKVKVLYLVDPGNPVPNALEAGEVRRLTDFIKAHNPGLVVLADTVYAGFPERFTPISKLLPENTVTICSWSKLFGATGWRLGALWTPRQLTLSGDSKPLHQRFSRPQLALPQQGAMTVFSLAHLTPAGKSEQKRLREMLRQRWNNLFQGLGMPAPHRPEVSHFFALVDLQWLTPQILQHHETRVLTELAERHGVVCLPGSGFEAPSSTIRVSLASVEDTERVGQAIRQVAGSIP